MKNLIPQEVIEQKIFVIRAHRVMLDSDLAKLYGVEVKRLKRAVKRNIERFPSDFMFELSAQEDGYLRCQFGTLKRGEYSKYRSYVFTQEGVAMLSKLVSLRAERSNLIVGRLLLARVRRSLTTSLRSSQ